MRDIQYASGKSRTFTYNSDKSVKTQTIMEPGGSMRKFTRTGPESFSCKDRFGSTTSFNGDFHMHGDGVYSYQEAGKGTIYDCNANHQVSTRESGDKRSVRKRDDSVDPPKPKPDNDRKDGDDTKPKPKPDDKVNPEPGKTEVIDGAQVKRDERGNITNMTYPNGKTREFTYDKDDKILTQTIDEPGKGARTYTNTGPNEWTVTANGQTLGVWRGDFAMYGNGKYAYQDNNGKAHDVTTRGQDTQRPDDGDHSIAHRKQADDWVKPKPKAPADILDRPITTEQSHDRAALEAARDGRPLLLVIGSGKDAQTQKTLNDAKAAAQKAGGKTSMLFVDTDKVDPKSPMGRFGAMVNEMHGTPYVQVLTQSQKTGEKKPVRPDTPIFEGKGATLDQNRLATALETAQKTQLERKMTGLPDPASIKDPDVTPLPKPRDPDTLPLDDPFKLNGKDKTKPKLDKFNLEDLLIPDPFNINGGKKNKSLLDELLDPSAGKKISPKPKEVKPPPPPPKPKPDEDEEKNTRPRYRPGETRLV